MEGAELDRGSMEAAEARNSHPGAAEMPDDSYEIRVTGTLPPEALLDYEDLTVTVQQAETVLDGQLADQAALNGLLARLEIFGARVILIRRH